MQGCSHRSSVSLLSLTAVEVGRGSPRTLTLPAAEPPRLVPHLVLDGLAVLGVADHCQLQLGHLLHLPVHVDLLQEPTDLAPQQAHRVLLALPLGQ